MNVFDIIGPVMIGPSSSHTAGAARLGRIARALLGQRPVRADILLHGSFAKTYRGHGTDKAIVAGVLGMAPDDARIRESLALAQMTGLAVSITPGEIDGAHPNTARIELWGEGGGRASMQGASVGGGNILVTQVNGLPQSWTARTRRSSWCMWTPPRHHCRCDRGSKPRGRKHLQFPSGARRKGRHRCDDH